MAAAQAETRPLAVFQSSMTKDHLPKTLDWRVTGADFGVKDQVSRRRRCMNIVRAPKSSPACWLQQLCRQHLRASNAGASAAAWAS
jgi:hypothetical protein